MPAHDEFFFPSLWRRDEYSKRRDGQYYEYSHYKQEIREDFQGRCGYCDSHENEIGGHECMELDHFRPKKYDEYKNLLNNPINLVWCCRGCNRLKTGHWPALGNADSHMDGAGFIDPCTNNRREYFEVDENGKINGKKPPAQYLITLLALNRLSRRRLREIRIICHTFSAEVDHRTSQMEHLLTTNLDDKQRRLIQEQIDWLNRIKNKIPTKILNFDLL